MLGKGEGKVVNGCEKVFILLFESVHGKYIRYYLNKTDNDNIGKQNILVNLDVKCGWVREEEDALNFRVR